MMRQRRRPGRSAFTVIELLVVIGIIAVIISLTTAAVMAIFRSQEKSTTELTIRRSDDALKAHVRAVLDQAKELPIPASVMTIAGSDPRRAKVIWQKLQLKRNFPMTFREAIYPWAIDGNPPAPVGTGVASPISATDLPPLDSYVKTVGPLVTAGSYALPGTYDPDESSHMLLLALSVKRRGVTFDVESGLGPSALFIDAQHQIKGIKDAWDQSVVFFRWPTDFPDNLAITGGDLQDTDRTLLDSNWNNATQYAAKGGVYYFEQLCHLVHDPTAATWTPRAFYAPLAIVSAGPNKRLGLLTTPLYPTNTPNFGMGPDGTADSYDNIVSTTLK